MSAQHDALQVYHVDPGPSTAAERFAGGSVLLYRVGGEPYASPLANVREVLDRASDGEAPVLQGQTLNVLPLRELFGAAEETSSNDDARVLLLVELTGPDDRDASDRDGPRGAAGAPGLVAFAVDAVHGMASVEAVYGVPDGITELPEGSILGAFFLGPATERGSPSTGASEASATRTEVRQRPADEGIMNAGPVHDELLSKADDELADQTEIVLIIDLMRLAREGRPEEG